MLADRMSRLEASGIRRIFDLMATMEDPINLSIGQAHFETPPELVEAACRAMRDGHNGYTTTRGLATLNEKILDSVEAARGARPESCMVTSGAAGGLRESALLGGSGFAREVNIISLSRSGSLAVARPL